jgi:predicted dehydrogenase
VAKRLAVGIVGFGKMGRVRAQAVAEHPALELVAVADPKLDPAARPSGCLAFDTADALLTHGVDAVFVCTPNAITADVVVAALDAGCHVFSEKPPGRDLSDVHRIREAEGRHPEQKLKFGFNHRYHGAVRQALALARTGSLGRLLWIRGVYGKSGGDGFEASWRSSREIAGGGILLDQGIHMIDLFRVFCGDFVEVKSFVSRSFWERIGVEDNAFALLRNARGQVAMLHSSATQWKHRFSLDIFLSEGYVAVNGILSGTRSYGRETLVVARRQPDESRAPGDPREEITFFDEDYSWRTEVAEFADCIVRDRPVLVGTSEDALRAMELVFRIYEDDHWLGALGVSKVGSLPAVDPL